MRQNIHELAEFYGLETQAFDEEPHRHVVAYAHSSVVFHLIKYVSSIFSEFLVRLGSGAKEFKQVQDCVMINLYFEKQYVCLNSFEHKASEKGAADVIASSMIACIQDESLLWITF